MTVALETPASSSVPFMPAATPERGAEVRPQQPRPKQGPGSRRKPMSISIAPRPPAQVRTLIAAGPVADGLAVLRRDRDQLHRPRQPRGGRTLDQARAGRRRHHHGPAAGVVLLDLRDHAVAGRLAGRPLRRPPDVSDRRVLVVGLHRPDGVRWLGCRPVRPFASVSAPARPVAIRHPRAVVSRWFPASERGFASSIFDSGIAGRQSHRHSALRLADRLFWLAHVVCRDGPARLRLGRHLARLVPQARAAPRRHTGCPAGAGAGPPSSEPR